MKLLDWAGNREAGLDPHKLTTGSNKYAHWVCHACPKYQLHRWTAVVGKVCKGSGCPCCQGRNTCIRNSLPSLRPDTAAEWNYSKNIGMPDVLAHYDEWLAVPSYIYKLELKLYKCLRIENPCTQGGPSAMQECLTCHCNTDALHKARSLQISQASEEPCWRNLGCPNS